MPQLHAKIGDKHFRLKKYSEDSYDIQQKINGVWNTIDNFGKVYGSPRPFAYCGYSFATAGLCFEHFVKLEEKRFAELMKDLPDDCCGAIVG